MTAGLTLDDAYRISAHLCALRCDCEDGAGDECRRHVEAERLGGLEIDN
jgi:hypothetical protein